MVVLGSLAAAPADFLLADSPPEHCSAAATGAEPSADVAVAFPDGLPSLPVPAAVQGQNTPRWALLGMSLCTHPSPSSCARSSTCCGFPLSPGPAEVLPCSPLCRYSARRCR